MKTTEPNCKTCCHLVSLAVAGDDERLFCSSNATKLLATPVGYITTGSEATFCGSYKKGEPQQEDDLAEVAEDAQGHRPALNPTFFLLSQTAQRRMKR